MKIAIVDDNATFAKQTEEITKYFFDESQLKAEIEVFSDGAYVMLNIDERKNYDIYLLAVQMPQLEGFKVAERIRLWDKKARIVFISSYEQYAIAGYQYRASGYILKDSCEEQLPKVLADIVSEAAQDGEEYYLIQNEQRYERFPVKNILYLKKEGKNVKFLCRNGAHYQERGTLEEIFEKLQPENFMYINRSEVVNLSHVTGIKKGNIELYHIKLPVSRYMMSEVKQTLLRYWGKC